jgi:NDP-sugar pyrophosphorylase family protein
MGLSPAEIPVAILAGGLGTRLRPALSDRPKALAEVGGRPFVTYLLDQVLYYGFRTVVLCTGYMGEQIADRLGDRYGELRLLHSMESTPLGTGGSLRLALPLLRSDVVLVMNGDSFCDVHLREFLKQHAERRSLGSIVLAEVPDTSRFGRLHVDTDNRVMSFVEKEKDHAGVAGLVNAGIYLFNTRLLKMPGNVGPVSLEKDLLPAWVISGLYGYVARGVFIDIGVPEAYRLTAQLLSRAGIRCLRDKFSDNSAEVHR